MHQTLINDQYLIHKPIFETQGLIIYKALVQNESEVKYYNIHCIHNKRLIKYYLTQLNYFSPTLPLEDFFIQGSDLYLVFSSKESGTPISHLSYSAAEKKGFLLSALAQFSLDLHLPNFVKSQLLNSDCLLIDRNQILHIDVKLSHLNPEQFNDFESIQTKVADLTTAIFEADDRDPGIKIFIDKCTSGEYSDYLSMLMDYKALVAASYDNKEPWLYEKLYLGYQKLKTYKRRIVIGALLLLLVYYGVRQLGASEASLFDPYQKTAIGSTQYDDPYSQPLEKEEQITIQQPVSITPAVQPTPVAVQPVAQPVTETDTLHTVKPGDFLVKISKSAYGDGKYAWALAKYNNIKNPSLLYKGMTLKIPPLKTIQEIFASSQGKK